MLKTDPKILLAPNIPQPLHGLNPRSIMGQDWWDVERQKAYKKAGYCCEACGVAKQEAEYHAWLEAHEVYTYAYAKGVATFAGLVALCHSCHNFIHSGRMVMLVRSGKMSAEKERDICRHGQEVLRKAGLRKRQPKPKKVAAWSDWCLMFNGVKYETQFASQEDWARFYVKGR